MKATESQDTQFPVLRRALLFGGPRLCRGPRSLRRIPSMEPPGTQPAAGRNGDAPPVEVSWPTETAYLSGLAHWSLGENAAASQALEKPATSRASPTAPYAQALLGDIAFMDRKHADAAKWWQALEAKKRSAWKLGEALAHTVFLKRHRIIRARPLRRSGPNAAGCGQARPPRPAPGRTAGGILIQSRPGDNVRGFVGRTFLSVRGRTRMSGLLPVI